jgi:hypothetical protein
MDCAIMPKYIIFFLLFVSTISAEYNDTIVNYIFENRNILKKYFQEKEYNWTGILMGESKYFYQPENIWQRESLFTTNANIESYYKHKKEIIYSIWSNRKLIENPTYFNMVLSSIKEGKLDIYSLKKFPSDILVKNKEGIKYLLHYFIRQDSLRWNDEEYRKKYDYSYKGYAGYAVLAQLDSVYNYKMIPLWDSYVKDILVSCKKKDIEEFQKRRFITASEFLKIANTCSDKKAKEKVNYYIERTTDSAIVHYVNKNYSKEKVIADFLEDPSYINERYIRYLGDTSIISELTEYMTSVKKADGSNFGYFQTIWGLLTSVYNDFYFEYKHFPVAIGYKGVEMWYRPEKHNNRPFSELYSENYMDFMKQYEAWIKKKFGKELKRKPQPDDIVVMGRGLIKD